jgi:hypothetical protein
MNCTLDGFVSKITVKMNPTFTFPSISEPGLPSLCAGLFMSISAGASYVLSFLPPNPENLPSLPSFDLFLKPFLSTLAIPAIIPNLAVGPVSLGKIGPLNTPNILNFNPVAIPKMLELFAMIPFKIFTEIINSIIGLSPKLPSLGSIKGIIISAGASLGLPAAAMNSLSLALGEAVFDLCKCLIPV